MSENVTSFGVMVPLVRPVKPFPSESNEAYSEWIAEIGLYINYEGTLLFSEKTEHNSCGIFFSKAKLRDELIQLCNDNDIHIINDQIQFYVSNWYNAADSHQSEITLEQFNESLEQ